MPGVPAASRPEPPRQGSSHGGNNGLPKFITGFYKQLDSMTFDDAVRAAA